MTAIVLAAVVAILVIGLVVTMIRGARAKPGSRHSIRDKPNHWN